MKALDQANLNKRYDEVRAEYDATKKAIAKLTAKQATLRRRLNRIHLNQAALGTREVPDYPTWLRISVS